MGYYDAKGGYLNSDLIKGSGHYCVNRLSVTAPHHCCMELHGFLFELCVGMGMAAGIDGVCDGGLGIRLEQR